MPEIRIVTFTGPSGAGKGTIVAGLLKKHPDWGLVVSLTSRGPREGRDLAILRHDVGDFVFFEDVVLFF